MKKVITFQVFILIACGYIWLQKPLGNYPEWLLSYELALNCILIAAVAGSLYCLRAVYLNKCVRKSWDEEWETWYYLRPLTSAISGLAAYIFLKAGLVVLEASQESDAANYGYLAFSFIAGLNVDKFVVKIEEIAKSTFGIEKSRSANDSENREK
ncbi:MAG: hypothetical protein P1U35_13540 [Cycloclasticus sp.]|nr:hypothetical protein [Cycloclasticus sp.]